MNVHTIQEQVIFEKGGLWKQYKNSKIFIDCTDCKKTFNSLNRFLVKLDRDERVTFFTYISEYKIPLQTTETSVSS